MLIYPYVLLAVADPKSRAFLMELYAMHHRVMYAQAYKVTGELQALDDIVSDACVKLLGKTDLLTRLPCHALSAYVVSTVRNTALDYIKARIKTRARIADLPDEAMHDVEANDTADGALLRQQDIDAVRQALSRLKGRDAELLDMKYRQDLPNAEIALRLGIGRDSVRQALKRARGRLSEIMRKEGALIE